jgi:protein disulfide-isomerase
MRKSAICLITAVILAQTAGAKENRWLTNLGKAQAEAKKQHKLVLMDFNGSDWCPACKILKKQVFSSPEFQAYAKHNLVLVDVDFPENTPQPAKIKKANQALAEKYGVDGFPTVIVLASNGKELEKKAGYEGESPTNFIAELEKLRNQS